MNTSQDQRVVVYLDQCVSSRFLEPISSTLWLGLRDMLFDEVQKKKLFCPNSLEHMAESAGLQDDNQAIELDLILRKLSDGFSLELEPRLIVRQIISRLRNLTLSKEEVFKQDLLPPISTDGAPAQLWQMRTALFSQNSACMLGVNEFNSLIPRKNRGDKKALDALTRLRSERTYLNPLKAEIAESLGKGHAVITATKADARFAHWCSVVVVSLINDDRMTPPEALFLLKLLNDEKLNFIPTLRIKAELEAMQFFKMERIEPRDQYDITRAACALPYVDFYVTDGGKAAAIRELKLDKIMQVVVHSTKEAEIRSLLEALSNRLNYPSDTNRP